MNGSVMGALTMLLRALYRTNVRRVARWSMLQRQQPGSAVSRQLL